MQHAIAIALAVFAAGAAAQGAARPDPADPKNPVPAAQYRSAFAGYRAFAGQEASRWREANDEAARLGGHMGHIRPERTGGAPAAAPAGHARGRRP